MLDKNKHHIRKEQRSKLWGMGFPGDACVSSRIIVTTKMRRNSGHFGTKLELFLRCFLRWGTQVSVFVKATALGKVAAAASFSLIVRFGNDVLF